jgi:hypothetical protein
MAARDGQIKKRVHHLASDRMFRDKNSFSLTFGTKAPCSKASELSEESLKERTAILVYLK